jgi:hypothetical protein
MQFVQNPAQLLAAEAAAFEEAAAGSPGSWKRLLNVLAVNHVFVPGLYLMATAFAEKVFGGGGPDDDPDEFMRSLIASMIAGPISGLFFFGAVASGTIEKLAGARTWGGALPIARAWKPVDMAAQIAKHLAWDWDTDAALEDFQRLAMMVPGVRQAMQINERIRE